MNMYILLISCLKMCFAVAWTIYKRIINSSRSYSLMIITADTQTDFITLQVTFGTAKNKKKRKLHLEETNQQNITSFLYRYTNVWVYIYINAYIYCYKKCVITMCTCVHGDEKPARNMGIFEATKSPPK